MKSKLRVISFILLTVIFSSLVLASCRTQKPEDQDPCKSGHSFVGGKCSVCDKADPDYKPEDNASKITADGVLFEYLEFSYGESLAGICINDFFVGADKDGSVFGIGTGEFCSGGEIKDIKAVYNGQVLSLYDIDGKCLFSLSEDELISALYEQNGLGESVELSNKLDEWYNNDFLGAVGNVNFAVITEQINEAVEKFQSGFITSEDSSDGASVISLRADELVIVINSYKEKTAYEVINEIIRDFLTDASAEDIPKELKDKLNLVGGIENITVKDAVSALLPYSLSEVIVKYKAAGGDVDQLVCALDKLAFILAEKNTVSELISEILSLEEPIDLREILTEEGASNLTVGALLKSIYNVGDAGLSFKLTEFYNYLKEVSLYEFLGLDKDIGIIISSLEAMGDGRIKIKLDELGEVSSLEIYAGDKSLAEYTRTPEGVYEISYKTDAISFSCKAQSVTGYTLNGSDFKISFEKPVFKNDDVYENYGIFDGYSVEYSADGKAVSVSYNLYYTESETYKQTVYLNRAVAVINEGGELVYILVAQNEYADGRVELSFANFVVS